MDKSAFQKRSNPPGAGVADAVAGGLPPLPGTYVLVMRLSRARTIRIGAFGAHRFCAGDYAYVGSACGPGGLAARLKRHLKRRKTPRWHVDYLRRHCAVRRVWFAVGRKAAEHRWAQALAADPAVSIPVPRFGASDCRCLSHLLYTGLNSGRIDIEGILPASVRCFAIEKGRTTALA
jgi:Uri superfamily endonuclease